MATPTSKTDYTTHPTKTGLIGLGAIGRPMAVNLHRAGYLHGVWNRSADKSADFRSEHDCVAFDDPAQLAGACNLICICVSADHDVLDVIDAMLAGLQPGTVVVDTSTVAPATARTAADRIGAHGGHFIDAPVSGGVEGARTGRLSMMAGGDAKFVQSIEPVLQSIASHITHMGPTGAGQATKAVNQVMAAGINQAVSEALAFAEALELPLDRVIEVTAQGAAASWFLRHRGPSMAAGRFAPGFRINLHDKDLAICQQMAASMDSTLPLVEMTRIHYRRLIEAGYADEDISALFRGKQALFQPG